MQAPSQETIKKKLSLSPVHIEFFFLHFFLTLLVLPHFCRNIVEPLPYFDLVRVCLRAFRPVGVDSGLSGVFALESSANHNVPFLPLCCRSAASTLCLFSLVPQPYLAGVKRHRET